MVATLAPMLAPMLDDRSQREQTARVQAAQAMAQRASARVERAKLAIAQVEVDLRRNEALARDGFVAATRLESDRLAAAAARREFEAAQQERHAAEHELEQAQAALGAVRPSGPAATGRAFAVRSPIGGQVLRVLQPSAATVSLGAPLLEVGNLDQLEVVAELLTSDAMQAGVGTPVRIERWGGSAPLAGRVSRVEPAAFTKVSALGVEEQRVKVIIEITSPRAQWRTLGDGFRVEVHLLVLSADKAVKVPNSGVFPHPDGQPGRMAAFVIDGSRAKLVDVALRARNGSEDWVERGLAPGAQVVVYPPPAASDGVRVRIRGR